jgi:hypothetical protein
MNLAMFVHVLGAIALVGSLVLVATALASRDIRLAYRSLLFALPAWIVMRVGAQWVMSEQGLDDVDPPPAWIDIGFVAAEPTFVFLLIATVCSGIAARRSRTGGGLRVVSLVLVGISLAAYLVAIWAMTTKPT